MLTLKQLKVNQTDNQGDRDKSFPLNETHLDGYTLSYSSTLKNTSEKSHRPFLKSVKAKGPL